MHTLDLRISDVNNNFMWRITKKLTVNNIQITKQNIFFKKGEQKIKKCTNKYIEFNDHQWLRSRTTLEING